MDAEKLLDSLLFPFRASQGWSVGGLSYLEIRRVQIKASKGRSETKTNRAKFRPLAVIKDNNSSESSTNSFYKEICFSVTNYFIMKRGMY